MLVLMNALCKLSLGALGHVNKILKAKAENGQKIDDLYISVIADIDENWFVILEHTINHLSFSFVHLLQLDYYFSCIATFFVLFFLFSSATIYF